MNHLIFFKVIRVHIVVGGVLAFFLGALLAVAEGGVFNPLTFVLGYGVVFLGDLSTHYSNDYFDVELDRHLKTKKVFSNQKILVKNPQLGPAIKKISLTLLLLSNALAATMVIFFGTPIEFLLITLAANLLGWAYSAPPFRLCSKSLGELAIAVATGLIIPSIGYLSVKGQLGSFFVYLFIPFMMYGFFLSLNLEAPDIENDKKGKKITLAVRTGSKNIFFIILTIAFLVTTYFCIMEQTFTNNIHLKTIFLISLIPSTAALAGFLTTFKKKNLNRFCTINIGSLFLFIILLNIHIICS